MVEHPPFKRVAARSNRAGRILKGIKMKQGFTLIELLIVIVIISTLASISAPTYLKVIERFRVLEATKTIYEIKKAQEEVKLRKGNYTDKFEDMNIEILDENNNPCTSNTCQLKYFTLQIRLEKNGYKVFAQRRSDKTPPPQRYSPNYIYFYNSVTDNFSCNDANCARDFLE